MTDGILLEFTLKAAMNRLALGFPLIKAQFDAISPDFIFHDSDHPIYNDINPNWRFCGTRIATRQARMLESARTFAHHEIAGIGAADVEGLVDVLDDGRFSHADHLSGVCAGSKDRTPQNDARSRRCRMV